MHRPLCSVQCPVLVSTDPDEDKLFSNLPSTRREETILPKLGRGQGRDLQVVKGGPRGPHEGGHMRYTELEKVIFFSRKSHVFVGPLNSEGFGWFV